MTSATGLLDTHDALATILAAMPGFAHEAVPLDRVCGRVLHQDVHAERDQPPFDRVTMDGVALRHAALAAGRRTFTIRGTQHAGDAQQTLDSDDGCIEVMTGTVLPEASDCVVPIERLQIDDGTVLVEPDYAAALHQFVHAQGSDHRQGYCMLSAGRRVAALDVALLASAGLASVTVAAQPGIRVISTGNELVPAGVPIAPHQVRLSNGPALAAMLLQSGYGEVRHDHLADEPELLRQALSRHLDEAEVLVLSGGVSMGKADFVPQVLTDLGVSVRFHKIAQRPGKPMWFGIGPRGQAVFALPGNPVSTLVCCRHYVLPALLHASGGLPAAPVTALIAEDFRLAADLTCFLPVRLETSDDGRLLAWPVLTNTSGDFTALSATDGYLELARDRQDFPAGSREPLHYWSRV